MTDQEMIHGVPVQEVRNRNGFSNVSTIRAFMVDGSYPNRYNCLGDYDANHERDFIQTIIEKNPGVFSKFQIEWFAD